MDAPRAASSRTGLASRPIVLARQLWACVACRAAIRPGSRCVHLWEARCCLGCLPPLIIGEKPPGLVRRYCGGCCSSLLELEFSADKQHASGRAHFCRECRQGRRAELRGEK